MDWSYSARRRLHDTIKATAEQSRTEQSLVKPPSVAKVSTAVSEKLRLLDAIATTGFLA
jgi:hypothetical protein